MRPSPASPAARIRALATGWRVLDAALGGGWPIGELTELFGRGRSTLALAAVRGAQSAGLPVAWIDGAQAFCPPTAGVDLARLTLVCPGSARGEPPRRRAARALLAADLLLRSRAFGLVVLDLPAGRGSLAGWFRLARQAQHGTSSLLLLAPETVAGSAAALTVRLALQQRPCASWELPPRPVLELSVLRRRGGQPVGPLLLDPAACVP